jgi:hypothetical protein
MKIPETAVIDLATVCRQIAQSLGDAREQPTNASELGL